MKTSNKILLGTLVVPLLVITLIHVSLYAKYRSGRYVSMKSVEEDRFTRLPLKHITTVALYGLTNVSISASGAARMEIEKNGSSQFHYNIHGDSLIIHGDSTVKRADGSEEIERSYQAVNIYLPAPATIAARESQLKITGSSDSLGATSYHFSLINSDFKMENDYGDSTHAYFKTIYIQADHSSEIELNQNATLQELELNLLESAFTDNGASINKLTVATDKGSTVTLKGSNLQKTTFTKP